MNGDTCLLAMLDLKRYLPALGEWKRKTTSGWKNKKGCGIGYALAASSCKGVDSVDACTIAAPDAITAFAVPNPGCSLQGSRFFRVWWLNELPRRAGHPAYFVSVNVTWTNLFSHRQFFSLVFRNGECSDVRHKLYAHACAFLLKKGVMPGVARAHVPRFALGLSADFRTTPGLIFFYSPSRSISVMSPLAFGGVEKAAGWSGC
jgi:hypothetical protein